MNATPVVKELSLFLADTFVYQLLCQNFHWNVTGLHFHSLHSFFEEAYSEVHGTVDAIAERIRALDSKPPASLKEILSLTRLNEAQGIKKSEEMLEHLLKSSASLCISLKKSIKVAEQDEDPTTADLLTESLQIYEKHAWMLRSLLQV